MENLNLQLYDITTLLLSWVTLYIITPFPPESFGRLYQRAVEKRQKCDQGMLLLIGCVFCAFFTSFAVICTYSKFFFCFFFFLSISSLSQPDSNPLHTFCPLTTPTLQFTIKALKQKIMTSIKIAALLISSHRCTQITPSLILTNNNTQIWLLSKMYLRTNTKLKGLGVWSVG